MPKICWNPTRIWEAISKHFSKCEGWYQIKTALSLYAKKDVVRQAPTGVGKTLSFFRGLVMKMEEHMVIIVSPLNLLSEQNIGMLEVAGLEVIALTAENNNEPT